MTTENSQALGQQLIQQVRAPEQSEPALYRSTAALIEQGADLTVREPHKSNKGYTAFEWAASNGYESVVLNLSAQVVKKNTEGTIDNAQALGLLSGAFKYADPKGEAYPVLKGQIGTLVSKVGKPSGSIFGTNPIDPRSTWSP